MNGRSSDFIPKNVYGKNAGVAPRIRSIESGKLSGRASDIQLFLYIKSIRLFITGDLAYQATVMGKDKSSGHHCPQCNLTVSTWSAFNHSKGNQWTCAALHEAVQEFEAQGSKKAVNGVIESMHYPNIEPEDFIVPILHTEMGMVNKCGAHLKDWMDEYVEQVTEEELNARKETDSERAVLSALKEEMEQHDLAMHLQVSELRQEAKELRKHLNQEKKRRPVVNENTIQEVNEELKSIQVEINMLQDENLDWKEAVKLSKERLKVKKGALTELKKKRPLNAQTMNLKMQICLKKFNIHPEVYHGGDLNGLR